MSRTYRRYPVGCMRSPRGRVRAIINGARKGAIPPDPYDDIMPSNEAFMPYRVARKLKDDGWSIDEIKRRIKRKFKLKDWEIESLLYWDR